MCTVLVNDVKSILRDNILNKLIKEVHTWIVNFEGQYIIDFCFEGKLWNKKQ